MKAFYSLEEMQKYYNRDTNTYEFVEDGQPIDIKICFDFEAGKRSYIIANDIQAGKIAVTYITANKIDAKEVDVRVITANTIIVDFINASTVIANRIIRAIKITAIDTLIANEINAKRVEAHRIIMKPKRRKRVTA